MPDANFARQLLLCNHACTGSHSAVPVTPSAILVSSSKYTGAYSIVIELMYRKIKVMEESSHGD